MSSQDWGPGTIFPWYEQAYGVLLIAGLLFVLIGGGLWVFGIW